jgi:uncharacterized protein YyaL (SSP411 family)
MAAALAFALGPVQEIVIVGRTEEEGTRLLLGEIRKRFLPDSVALLKDDVDGTLAEIAPFVVPMTRKDGKPTAYVCRDQTCRLPVTEPGDLAALLDEALHPAAPVNNPSIP